jgi:hypothetical protein
MMHAGYSRWMAGECLTRARILLLARRWHRFFLRVTPAFAQATTTRR